MKKRVEGRRKTVEEMRGDGRGKTGEEAHARYILPLCLWHEKNPHKTGNLAPLMDLPPSPLPERKGGTVMGGCTGLATVPGG